MINHQCSVIGKQLAGIACFVISIGLIGGVVGCKTPMPKPEVFSAGVEPAALVPANYVLKVHATCQDYNFPVPWRKYRPYSNYGMGVLINGGHLLVPASLLRNHTFIELEKVDSGVKTTGKLLHIDYTANLALVQPEGRGFLDGMKSLEVMDKLLIGDAAEAWQFEANGIPHITAGKLLRVESGYSLMNYRFNINLPTYASTPVGMPVVSDGKLVGVSKSYTGSTQSLNAIPAQIINHFLRDMKEGDYQGFPGAGFGYTLLDDPQLRQFIGLPDGQNGVYVTYVRPKSPAAKAGIRKGDVVLGIDSFDLDRKGQYDDPDYGRLHFYHLLSTKSYSGTVRRFNIWRDKALLSRDITLQYLPKETYPVPPYIYDRGPDYVVVGGFVIQELSRQYLRSWKNWQDEAPQRLVHYDRNQWELATPGYKPVIIGVILPAQGTQGYEQFNFKRIETVNGKQVKDLREVADALKHPVKKNGNRFHHFTFFNQPREVALELDQVKADNAFIKERFQIPAMQRFYK